MPRRIWAFFATSAILAALGITTLAWFSAGCGGDSSSQQALVADSSSPATATPAPASLADAPATATPLSFAVTPEALSYSIEDPAFEALPAARALFGVDEGAAYKIEVPDSWNGDLVLYAHGYRGYSLSLTVDPPPLREHLIANGYAWAASSYQANGYAVGVGAEDTRRLVRLFTDLVGDPEQVYLYGSSMGGHITTYLMEEYPTAFDGALAECGAVAGVEVLDYFTSWALLASHLTGVDDGSTSDPARFQAAIAEIDTALGPVESPTLTGRRFESVMSELTGGPRPWRHEGFEQGRAWNFFLILDALRNPEPSLLAATNVDERYHIASGLGLSEGDLNSAVPRMAASPDVRNGGQFPALTPVSGQIERPYLSIANTGDFFVPISQQQIYRRLVQAAGNDDLLVQRAIRRPGHCNFTPVERMRAFDDLVLWVEEGSRPPGDDLLGDLTDAGRSFTRPLLPGDPGSPQ